MNKQAGSRFLLMMCLFAVGCFIRAVLIYRGGIWSDEGLVLNIVSIGSWREMLSFVAWHESHPPLFYLLVRAWQRIVGNGDTATLVLPVILGALVAPVTYFVGSVLFSRRTALAAGTLALVSPSLAEHSAQLRPYGLLPLLALLSSFELIRALETNRAKHWMGWVISTTAMLYTHHWGWLALGGQMAAALYCIVRTERRAAIVRSMIVSVIALALLYLPWANAFLFQAVNAGHPGMAGRTAMRIGLFLAAGVATLPFMLFFATVSIGKPATVLVAVVALVALALDTGLMQRVKRGFDPLSKEHSEGRSGPAPIQTAMAVLLITPAVALAAGLLFSLRSNLILDRCVVMFTPMLLLPVAQWIAGDGGRGAMRARTGIMFLIVVPGLSGIVALSSTRRSNAREVAAIVKDRLLPGDMLIVAPEWRAPGFNHYFPRSIDQIDYPYRERSGLIDFAHLRDRKPDSAAMVKLVNTIAEASKSRRRIWFVTDRSFIAPAGSLAVTRVPDPVGAMNPVKDALAAAYGQPDTSNFERIGSSRTRYEQMIPFLFAPRR